MASREQLRRAIDDSLTRAPKQWKLVSGGWSATHLYHRKSRLAVAPSGLVEHEGDPLLPADSGTAILFLAHPDVAKRLDENRKCEEARRQSLIESLG